METDCVLVEADVHAVIDGRSIGECRAHGSWSMLGQLMVNFWSSAKRSVSKKYSPQRSRSDSLDTVDASRDRGTLYHKGRT